MATHSSIFAWTILWTEEPGGLKSMGSQSWIEMKRLNIHMYVPSESSLGNVSQPN